MAPDDDNNGTSSSGADSGTADIADTVFGDASQRPEEEKPTSIRLPERIDNKYVKEALKVLKPIAKYAAINYPEEAPNAFVKNSLSVLAALEEERKQLLKLADVLIAGNTYLEGFAIGFKFLKDVVEGTIHYVPESKENPLRFAKTHLEQELGRNGFLELAKSANFDKIVDVMVRQTIEEVTERNISPENLTEDAAKLVNARLYARLKAFCHILGEKGANFDQAGNGFLKTQQGEIAISLTDPADFAAALVTTGTFERQKLQRFIVEERKESTQYLKDQDFETTLEQAGLSEDQFRYIMNTVLNGSVTNEETIRGSLAGIRKMQSSANFHFNQLDGQDKALDYLRSVDIKKLMPKGMPDDKIEALNAEKNDLIARIESAKNSITNKDSAQEIATFMNLIENDLPAFCKKMGLEYPQPKHFFKKGAYEMIKVLKADAINSAIEKAIDGFEFPKQGALTKEEYEALIKEYSGYIDEIREQKETFLKAAYNSNEYFESLFKLLEKINCLKTLAEKNGASYVDPLLVIQAETDVKEREVENKTYPSKATGFINHKALQTGFQSFSERIRRFCEGVDVAPPEENFLQKIFKETRYQEGRAWWKSIFINPLGAALAMGAAHIDAYISPKNGNIWHVGQVTSPLFGLVLGRLGFEHLPVQSVGNMLAGPVNLVTNVVGGGIKGIFGVAGGALSLIPGIGQPIGIVTQGIGLALGSTVQGIGFAGTAVAQTVAIGVPDIAGATLQNIANMKRGFLKGVTGANTNKPIEGQGIHEGRVHSRKGEKLANEEKLSLSPLSKRQEREENLERIQKEGSEIGELYLLEENPEVSNFNPTPPSPTTPPTPLSPEELAPILAKEESSTTPSPTKPPTSLSPEELAPILAKEESSTTPSPTKPPTTPPTPLSPEELAPILAKEESSTPPPTSTPLSPEELAPVLGGGKKYIESLLNDNNIKLTSQTSGSQTSGKEEKTEVPSLIKAPMAVSRN